MTSERSDRGRFARFPHVTARGRQRRGCRLRCHGSWLPSSPSFTSSALTTAAPQPLCAPPAPGGTALEPQHPVSSASLCCLDIVPWGQGTPGGAHHGPPVHHPSYQAGVPGGCGRCHRLLLSYLCAFFPSLCPHPTPSTFQQAPPRHVSALNTSNEPPEPEAEKKTRGTRPKASWCKKGKDDERKGEKKSKQTQEKAKSPCSLCTKTFPPRDTGGSDRH